MRDIWEGGKWVFKMGVPEGYVLLGLGDSVDEEYWDVLGWFRALAMPWWFCKWSYPYSEACGPGFVKRIVFVLWNGYQCFQLCEPIQTPQPISYCLCIRCSPQCEDALPSGTNHAYSDLRYLAVAMEVRWRRYWSGLKCQLYVYTVYKQIQKKSISLVSSCFFEQS